MSAGWPDAVLPVFKRAITVEYTSLTRDGRPITVPITPYVEPNARTIDISTGLSYPAKAERARRNPRVSLLFADPVGSGLVDPPVVLVQGVATVRDADLQANTDRYVRETMAKLPAAFKGQPRFVLRRMAWYFARIWIEVTPLRIWWWASRALDAAPQEWTAPPGTSAPASDPAPPGQQPAAWLEAPADWRAALRQALARLDQRDLSWVADDGFPVNVPVLDVEEQPEGLRLRLGPHPPATPRGPACLTLHTHTTDFTAQENRTLVGELTSPDVLRVQRALADVSLSPNKLARTLDLFAKSRRLAPRFKSEAARRGQPVPTVRFADERL